ncbi:hypothetical protein [Sapientia aquatica]|uniref:Lipoprotein n=1 Tax=Sapientia aquatica TaxID=1549640 RepID=A0A4R5VWK5_9BURK|nr:hypothetical protein [Sapientia aquatica]TDK63725.1 hypothetical protein E2I14_14220 [Sapientia aquatica]
MSKPSSTITFNMIKLVGCLILIFGTLTGCFHPNKTISWKEEVQLSNGKVIVVECSTESRNVYDGNSMGWLLVHDSIKTVFPPSGAEVRWVGSLMPLALDMSANGEIYLVAIAQTSQAMEEYSTTSGYAAFKFTGNGSWTRIPVESVPKEIVPNMLLQLPEDLSKTVNLLTKEKLNSNPRFDRSYRGWLPKSP